ncbi:polysaccharide biosynthesis protein [Thalassobacillus devorans]|uniref:Polysaccharide biosynthesis protein n=1 Tax=Thalassobacillus devorans TaxID=279813 RepID=A0ABQ1P1H5_9BACI|nr:oligosaccharide flippase family protein [Thalassobacillus devorans]NIK28601.1 O-antigen/teichoic acid export membrane protein [Thalassobacillus devorans]GGC84964.1 polysaccharide biosynthesis protein [Thalassobacillus devorans]
MIKEKVQQIFNSSLMKSSSVYTLANMMNAAIPFFMLPILTRYLTPADYGIVSMFTVIIGFLIPLIGINIHGAINRQYFEKEVDISKYITTGLLFLIGNSVVFSLLIWLLAGPISNLTSFPKEWLWAALLVAIAQVVFQITLVMWQVRVKPIPFGVFQVTQTTLNVGLSLWFIVLLGFDWQGRIQGQTIAFTLAGFFGLIILIKDGWVKVGFEVKYLKNLFSFGLPLIPHALGTFIITMSDRLFITNMIGVAETGIYTVGYQIGMIIMIIQDSFNKAWVPWFYNALKKNDEALKIKIIKITYSYYVLIIIFALMLSVLSPWLITYFIGDSFRNASQFVFWVALGYAFNGMYKMVTNYIFFIQKTYLLAWLTFLTASLNVIFNYFLIKMNGSIGAAQSTTLAFLVSFILTWLLASKLYRMPWSLKS